MLDLSIVSSSAPPKAAASGNTGSVSGDFSRALADADGAPDPDPAAAPPPTIGKNDHADRQDVAADGKDVPDTDPAANDPALIGLIFIAPTPTPLPLPLPQLDAAPAIATAAVAPTNAVPVAGTVAGSAVPASAGDAALPNSGNDGAASTDQTAAAALRALDAGDTQLSPDALKAIAAARAAIDTALTSPAAGSPTPATAAAPGTVPAPIDAVQINPAPIDPAAAPIAVATSATLAASTAATAAAVPASPRRADKADQPSGQRAASAAATLAALAGNTVDGPVIGLVQPAARAFASAIAATTAGLRRDPRDPGDDGIGLIASSAPGATTHGVAAALGDSATLDTRGAEWRAALVDHIETLRDAADARDTRIRLVPDALGKIDVAISKSGDSVNVRFTTETPAARQLLTDARPQLAALAEARGLRIGQTSVDGGGHGSAQGQAQQRPSNQPIQNRRAASGDASTTEPADVDGWIA